ncbi:MAG: diguanylate cyclase response regulator [Geobacteraceae bacterium GWC2_53_11]|nr:MAG: diguanylate cyclase response regulator [Geobacteraceae bacterium GWC2_53_11]
MTLQNPPTQILIAEDDPISRSLLELYLDQEGYSYVSATNGQEALDLYNAGQFSIVITDWLMPEMDGTTLCRAIRSQTRDYYTFLILLTAQNSPKALVEGLEAGADDYIVKPINRAELRVRLKGCRRILDLEHSLKQSLAEIRELSIHDPLTGAFNRGYLDQQLEHEIQRAYRYRHPLSLVLCDLDHFKLVNDTYGHQVGDTVLQRCVHSITQSIRHQIDWVARYGGEEFVIALPETDTAGCSVVAERMRERIAFSPDDGKNSPLKISASFGTVTLVPDAQTLRTSAADLIQRADICLYRAKLSGRNRVVAETSAEG